MMKSLRVDKDPADAAEHEQFFDNSVDFILFLAGQALTQLDGDQFLRDDG